MKPKIHLNTCHVKKYAADVVLMTVNKNMIRTKHAHYTRQIFNLTTDNEINSEIDMKKRLVKTRVDMIIWYIHI